MGGLAAAFEQDGVAALEAEGRDLHEGVRAGLEDHADDADRAGDAVELQAFVELDGGEGLADGVGQLDQAVDAGTDVGELAFVEFQPLEQRGREVALLGGVQVLLVGLEDLGSVLLQGLGDLVQRVVFHFRLDRRQPNRRRLRRRRTLRDFHFP